jgi:hypothetical protein
MLMIFDLVTKSARIIPLSYSRSKMILAGATQIADANRFELNAKIADETPALLEQMW